MIPLIFPGKVINLKNGEIVLKKKNIERIYLETLCDVEEGRKGRFPNIPRRLWDQIHIGRVRLSIQYASIIR